MSPTASGKVGAPAYEWARSKMDVRSHASRALRCHARSKRRGGYGGNHPPRVWLAHRAAGGPPRGNSNALKHRGIRSRDEKRETPSQPTGFMNCQKSEHVQQSRVGLAVLSAVGNKHRNKLPFSEPSHDPRKPIPAAMLRCCGEGSLLAPQNNRPVLAGSSRSDPPSGP